MGSTDTDLKFGELEQICTKLRQVAVEDWKPEGKPDIDIVNFTVINYFSTTLGDLQFKLSATSGTITGEDEQLGGIRRYECTEHYVTLEITDPATGRVVKTYRNSDMYSPLHTVTVSKKGEKNPLHYSTWEWFTNTDPADSLPKKRAPLVQLFHDLYYKIQEHYNLKREEEQKAEIKAGQRKLEEFLKM